MRGGPFDEQIATALPTLRAGTATLDQFFQQWDILLTGSARARVQDRHAGSTKSCSGTERVTRDYTAQLHNICGTTAMSVPFIRIQWTLGSQFAARIGAEYFSLWLMREVAVGKQAAAPFCDVDHIQLTRSKRKVRRCGRALESGLGHSRGCVMSVVCPLYTQHRTSPDPVGTSRMGDTVENPADAGLEGRISSGSSGRSLFALDACADQAASPSQNSFPTSAQMRVGPGISAGVDRT